MEHNELSTTNVNTLTVWRAQRNAQFHYDSNTHKLCSFS